MTGQTPPARCSSPSSALIAINEVPAGISVPKGPDPAWVGAGEGRDEGRYGAEQSSGRSLGHTMALRKLQIQPSQGQGTENTA